MHLPNIRKLDGRRRKIARNAALAIAAAILVLLLDRGHTTNTYGDKSDGTYRLENRYAALSFDPLSNSFELTNLRNGRVYRTEPYRGFSATKVTVTSNTSMEIVFRVNDGYGGFDAAADMELQGSSVKGTLKAPGDAPLAKPFAFPGAFSGAEERQYLVIPYAEGLYVPADRKFDLGDFEMWAHKATMPFTGMTDSRTGIMVTSGSPCDTAVEFVGPGPGETAGGSANCLMRLVHYPQKGSFGYDRTFYIDLVQNDGYNEMADIYRNRLEGAGRPTGPGGAGGLVTLRDKLKANKNVGRLVGASDFWLGPTEMKDSAVVDELLSSGISKVLVNFQYGWTVYDDEKRPEVVRYAAQKGLLPGRYDCYSDIFDPKDQHLSQRLRTDGFLASVIIDRNGGYQKGYSTSYKNTFVQGYRQNSAFSVRDADAYIRADLRKNSYLSRFVDVITSCELYEDYSTDHPMTRSQDMDYRRQLLDRVSSGFGLVTGSEETAWWAIPVTHYSEGTMTIVAPQGAGDDWSTPIDNPGGLYEKYTVNPVVRIPLKSLVYHDCHVSGWYTGDGVSKVMKYWKTKDLLTALYGAMDLIFPVNRGFFDQYRLQYLWSMKVTGWVFEKTGYAKMERHDFLTEDGLVQRTEFSNGIRVIANFSGKPYMYKDRLVPANDFILMEGSRTYTSGAIAAGTYKK